MYISYNWLKDFIKLPKNISIEEISKNLTLKTVEVEGFRSLAQNFNNIIVVEVISVVKHEKADRLNLVKVKTKSAELEIVCGADNVEAGQKVALALPGAILPNGLEIKEAEIRGVISKGMICAADELGLGEDHEGILVLDKKAKIGQSLANYLNLDDYVLEIDNKSLSNRGDLWGHYGMARELSAIFSIELKNYDQLIENLKFNQQEKIQVKIEEKELCPRYCSLVIDNLKIEDSPDWLKNRLLAVGLKPINNIVDVTNYVMIELGQPMHAFDANKVSDIKVGLAQAGDEIELLDGEIAELSNKDLVVKSQDEIIALAGVMGAKNSSISTDTKKIILESANFQAISVRQTATRLNKRTESSIRFEKTLDPNLTILAIKRAANLIKKICPRANISGEIVDVNNFRDLDIKIVFSLTELNNFLAIAIDIDELKKILTNLGFDLELNENELITVKVPSWRALKDVKIKEDIFEEVARIYGYDNIQSAPPLVYLNSLEISEDLDLIKIIKEYLILFPFLYSSFSCLFKFLFILS